MADLDYIDWASLVLVVVGALNWGLVGLGGFMDSNLNVVEIIFTNALGMEVLTNLVYLLVGIAGLYMAYFGYELYEE